MNLLRIVSLASLALLFSCQVTRAASYTYTLFNIPGGNTEAADINNLGQVVGVYFPSNGVRSGFFYDHGSYTLATLPQSIPYIGNDFFALNDVGQIVGVGTDRFTYDKGFLDDHGVFSLVNVPGSVTTIPYGINNMGVIIGSYSLPGQNTSYGFILSAAGVYTTVSIPGASSTSLSGINDLGQISGYYIDATGGHSFLYTNGQITPLTNGGGAINNLGQIITGSSGILNPDGTVSIIAVPGYDHAFINGINDAGQVTGYAFSQSGMDTSFIATPTTAPEPQAISLAALAIPVLLLAMRNARRKSISVVAAPLEK